MTDFLARMRAKIDTRMEEIRPAVEEYSHLAAAVRALDGVDGSASGTPTLANRSRATPTAVVLERPARRALEAVTRSPGLTIPELATALEVPQNQLYRRLPELAAAGLVRQQGRGWHPVRS